MRARAIPTVYEQSVSGRHGIDLPAPDVPPDSTPQPTALTYVVKSGDSLVNLGHRFKTTGRSIAYWNRKAYPSLDPDKPRRQARQEGCPGAVLGRRRALRRLGGFVPSWGTLTPELGAPPACGGETYFTLGGEMGLAGDAGHQ